MRKLLHILLFAIMILMLSSCVRKSRRKASTAANKQYVAKKQTQKSRRNVKLMAPAKPVIKNEAPSRKIMTGAEVFSKYNSAVFMIYTYDDESERISQGSGFFISSSGIAVSNYHVFAGTSIGEELIILPNKKEYQIEKVIAKDKENDFIIFKVKSPSSNFNYIPIETKKPTVGEKVFAIGSPRGLENTFSSGEISQIRGDNLIQISAPIDHGSSGGALINEYGNVIGITSSGLDDSGANLNFAVNIKALKPYLK